MCFGLRHLIERLKQLVGVLACDAAAECSDGVGELLPRDSPVLIDVPHAEDIEHLRNVGDRSRIVCKGHALRSAVHAEIQNALRE